MSDIACPPARFSRDHHDLAKRAEGVKNGGRTGLLPIVRRSCPSPSGFQPRIGVRGMLSIAGMASWVAGTYSRTNRSCRLVAGTPRYENWVHWLMEGFGHHPCTQPTPSWGQAPALHFSLPAGNEPQLEGVSGPIIRASER